jgi:chromosomal replication initiation ATPase DnaA
MPEIRQLPLDLPVTERHGREDWIVSPANAEATALVERWPDWPSDVVLLIGPAGSGKSHLARVLAEASGAAVLAAADLAAIDPTERARIGTLVVEDLGAGLDETALFHLLNAVRQAGGRLLLTAETPLAAWGLGLPDLVSRLRAATPVRLAEPDDALLAALLAKLFADRQTVVDPSVIACLVPRMERSFAAARTLVAALDRAALAAKSPVTRAMAIRVLAATDTPDPSQDELDESGDA